MIEVELEIINYITKKKSMIIKRFILSIAFALMVISMFANGLNISVEGLNFFEESGKTIIDINYAVKYNNLTFKQDDKSGLFVAALKVDCAVINLETKKVVLRESFTEQIVVSNAADAQNETKIHNDRFGFDYDTEGNALVMKFTDVVSGAKYDFKKMLQHIDGRNVSDIELENYIADNLGNKSKHLLRNETLYFSNPERVFYKELSDSLYCYFQLKDLQKINKYQRQYNFKFSVEDSKGKTVVSEVVNGQVQGKIASLVKGVYIQDLAKGIYTIKVENIDKFDNNISTTDFSISDYIGEMVSMLPDPTEEYHLMKMFGYDNGLSSWKGYPRSRKIREINKFWNTYSATVDMSIEQLSEVIKERVAYCNLKFSSKSKGWKSDRAKIYILYGAPDDIDKYLVGELDATDQSNNSDVFMEGRGVFNDREYEIWRYTSSRIASYTFFDTKMDNSHKLIYVYNDPNMEISEDWKFYLGNDFDEEILKQ
jgi:GWxTD domain-containing protein